jgi:FtsP/CotA-like multicopper oxidase with cupredoxin domain
MSHGENGQHYARSFEQRKLTCEHYISYRLRLVSISCDPAYNFSIDSHQLTIIEADGINVQQLTVDSLEIFAGK